MSKYISLNMIQIAMAFLAFTMILSGCEEEMEEYAASINESGLIGGEKSSPLKHCVVESTVYSARDNKLLYEPEDDTPVCFRTFSKAIEFATNGRVVLSEDATPETVTDEEINGPTVDQLGPAATFVVGIEYEHANFGGATLTISSGVTCSGYTLSLSSMPSGWNDVISSAKAYSYCNHSLHYEHVNFSGASIDCGTACSYVGAAMNDRTSSLKWWQ